MKATKRILILLACAIFGYFLTLVATPRVVLLALKLKSNGVLNQPFYNDIISAKDRMVALPNPDFLYIAMGYDVRDHDLLISGKMPDTSYCSLALYDTQTRNYFILNDQQAGGDYEILLTTNSAAIKAEADCEVIQVPSKLGFVLVRILITDLDRMDYLKEIQHSFKAQPHGLQTQ